MASLAEQRVSMVLLTYNCARAVEGTLARLREADVPLIIVDNGSTDGTVARLRGLRWPGMELVALPRNVGAVARNEGLKRARTPYVAFCDDDMCWDREGLTLAADLLDAHPRLGLVNARILVDDERRLDPSRVRWSAARLWTTPASLAFPFSPSWRGCRRAQECLARGGRVPSAIPHQR